MSRTIRRRWEYVTAVGDFDVEVGAHIYGLCYGIGENPWGQGHHLGDCGPFDEVGSFPNNEEERQYGFHITNLCEKYREIAWGIFENLSNQDLIFLSQLWKRMSSAMGTRLSMSTAYHLQTDG